MYQIWGSELGSHYTRDALFARSYGTSRRLRTSTTAVHTSILHPLILKLLCIHCSADLQSKTGLSFPFTNSTWRSHRDLISDLQSQTGFSFPFRNSTWRSCRDLSSDLQPKTGSLFPFPELYICCPTPTLTGTNNHEMFCS